MKYSKLCTPLLISSFLLFPLKVHANENVGRLLSGLVGGVIQAIDSNSEKRDFVFNEKTRKIESTYNARVAEIQKNLKSLEIYEGSVDGLMGAKTQKAIDNWEQVANSTIDGKISDRELELIKADVKNDLTYAPLLERMGLKKKSKSQSKQKNQNNLTSNEQKIFDLALTYRGHERLYKSCKEFKDEVYGAEYYFNKSFDKNFSNFSHAFMNMMEDESECLNIPSKRFNELKSLAEKQYSSSKEARMHKINAMMMISGQGNQQEFIKGCKTISMMHGKDWKDEGTSCDANK